MAQAQPAQAQTARPRLEPSADVTVAYHYDSIGSGGSPGRRVYAWLAAARQVRIQETSVDGPSAPDYVVVDLAGRRGFRVDPTAGTTTAGDYLELSRGMPVTLPPGVRFTRMRQERMLGLPCTRWRMTLPGQWSGTTCVTADGVTLQFESTGAFYMARSEGMTATSVTYAEQDPARFQPPR
jgi:hypothetical protein